MNAERQTALRSSVCRNSHSSFIIHHSSFPAGISLIEVLFAMGILSVGILSLVLLIPLGAYELGEAAKLDQGSTLGRAAFRDLEVRGYLQPNTWVDTQAGMLIAPVLNPDPDPTLTYNPTPGQRIIAYPYLPANCMQYFPPQAYGGPPLTTTPPNIPTQPQLYPQQFPPSAGLPFIGVSMIKMLNASANYPPYNPSPTYPASATYTPLTLPPFAATDAPLVVLDPLMVATAAQNVLAPATGDPATVPAPAIAPANWTLIQTFPYQQTYVPGAPVVPRLTLLSSPLPPFGPPGATPPAAAAQLPVWPNVWYEGAWTQPRIMPFAIADRIFRSTDDLLFNPTDPAHDRPTAAVFGGKEQYQGSYSWFVTIAPTSSELDSASNELGRDPVMSPDPLATAKTAQFTASVVVCQNRQFDFPPTVATDVRPGEWMVPVLGPPLAPGPGLGGGEVVLAATTTTSPTGADQVAWLAGLRTGQWLMLSGITISAEIRLNGANPVYWPKFKTVADWYRIVAVDDGSQLAVNGTRNVTLHGSDWPQPIAQQNPVSFAALQSVPIPGVQYVNLNSSPAVLGGAAVYTYATVVEGVVGVFQKTITLDTGSPFTPQQ